MKNLKKELRDQIRQRRKNLSLEERKTKSREICQTLLQDLSSRKVGKLFSYLALKEEPDLQEAMEQAVGGHPGRRATGLLCPGGPSRRDRREAPHHPGHL